MSSLLSAFTRVPFIAALAGLLVGGGLMFAPWLPDADQASRPAKPAYASVTVDTSPLGTGIYPPTAGRLHNIMSTELARLLPVTGDSDAPRLVVRLTQVSVPPARARDRTPPAATDPITDHMEGETLVLAPSGAVLKRLPVTVSTPAPPHQGEPGLEADFRRLETLARSYANWSARYLEAPQASQQRTPSRQPLAGAAAD